jgi:hypothetical protein
MGFVSKGVWVMGYCGLMGYGVQIPANRVGGPEKLWDFRVYGLSRVWVKGVSTVHSLQACALLMISPSLYYYQPRHQPFCF